MTTGAAPASAAAAPTPAPGPAAGPWAPLRRPVFRWVWIAAFVANLGTWMQTVGGQWLLVEGHSSSLLISLVQSASSLPVLLLVIPAGAVADFFDRRRLLLAVQGVQAVIAGILALLTAAGRTSICAARFCWRMRPRTCRILPPMGLRASCVIKIPTSKSRQTHRAAASWC